MSAVRTFQQLTESEQTEACEHFYAELVRDVCEGALRFNDELNEDDLQARIDAASEEMDRMQTPWFLAERLHEDKKVREDLEGMARLDAEDALYVDADGPRVVRLETSEVAS